MNGQFCKSHLEAHIKVYLTEPGRAGDAFHRSLLAKPGLEVWAGIRSGLGCGGECPKQRKQQAKEWRGCSACKGHRMFGIYKRSARLECRTWVEQGPDFKGNKVEEVLFY